MINVGEKKERIISYLRENGPSLPVRIAKAIEMEPVFASAILSEVFGEKRIKMSHMKVGTSSLYLLEGQESLLEEKIDSLRSVEKEAFLKLKSKKVLKDNSQDPAIRVALRGIRDFAIPFKFNEEIYWRYAFSSEEEVRRAMSGKSVTEKPKPKVQDKKPSPKKKVEKILSTDEPKPEFFNEVKSFIESRRMEFLEEIEISKKEVVAKVRVDSSLGKIDFLVVAKNKKSVRKDEINSAVQRATHSKMPCLILIKKAPTKTISNFIKDNHLVKILVM